MGSTARRGHQVCRAQRLRHLWQSEFGPARLIATHYLLLVKPTAYVPPLYEYKESWQSRLVYTAFRDALEVEKLMGICMSWNNAREYAVLVVC